MKKIMIICLSMFIMTSCVISRGRTNNTIVVIQKKFQCGVVIVEEATHDSIDVTYQNGTTSTIHNPKIVHEISTGYTKITYSNANLVYVDVIKKDETHERTARYDGRTFVCKAIQ